MRALWAMLVTGWEMLWHGKEWRANAERERESDS